MGAAVTMIMIMIMVITRLSSRDWVLQSIDGDDDDKKKQKTKRSAEYFLECTLQEMCKNLPKILSYFRVILLK